MPQAFILQDVPVADAKPADIQDLLGGALFKALYKWMRESGPVYLLPTGKAASIGQGFEDLYSNAFGQSFAA